MVEKSNKSENKTNASSNNNKKISSAQDKVKHTSDGILDSEKELLKSCEDEDKLINTLEILFQEYDANIIIKSIFKCWIDSDGNPNPDYSIFIGFIENKGINIPVELLKQSAHYFIKPTKFRVFARLIKHFCKTNRGHTAAKITQQLVKEITKLNFWLSDMNSILIDLINAGKEKMAADVYIACKPEIDTYYTQLMSSDRLIQDFKRTKQWPYIKKSLKNK